jgi:hypothetical protein
MSYTPPVSTPVTAATHVLLAANRLEARPRSAEFNRALRAEVRDASWLLARQWQLHEFRAEDRGTPAYVEVQAAQLPLSQLSLPGQPQPRPYAPAHQPLEAAVEAQPRPLGLGLRLQMGEYWLRLLRTEPSWAAALAAAPDDAGRAAAQSLFAQLYPLAWPKAADAPVAYAQQASTPEVQALQAVAGPAAFDGYKFYQKLLEPFAGQLGAALADSAALEAALQNKPLITSIVATAPYSSPATPLLAQGLAVLGQLNTTPFDGLARQYVLAMHRLYLLGTDAPGAWASADLGYAFGVGTAGAAQAVGLGTTHYPGGGALPWYAVDAVPAPADPTPAATELRRVLPTEVQFPGAPAARWWEFEDRRVDFGQVTGDPSDWGRMLLQEFMFLYQNDWFSIPYTLEAGRVVAVQSVQVTDVFGRTYALEPAGAGTQVEPGTSTRIDNDANRWRLFGQTDASHTGPAPAPQLYLPATALAPLVGRPVEQVSFRREEATNLVWAVESIVPDGFAGGLDGSTAAGQLTEALRRLAPAAPAPAEPATYAYQVVSTVPENWVPFVPQTAAAGTTTLVQGALARQVPGLAGLPAVAPRTSLLLLHPTEPYVLHEHELPPAGLRVEGLSYRARWHGGRAVGWFGRQRGPAQSGGSSGLAFDLLTPGAR